MSRNLAVAAAALAALGAPVGRMGSGPSQPLGGLRPNGGKFGPFTLSTRERSRLAWRSRVDAAAREMNRCREYCLGLVDGPDWDRVLDGGPEAERFDEATTAMDASRYALDDALAAPKPWRSPRKPDPRRRYSRAHRRACRKCDTVRMWLVEARWGDRNGLKRHAAFARREHRYWRRNPHGRRDR